MSKIEVADQLDALHNAIMNIPGACTATSSGGKHWYKIGHLDACHAAASLVSALESPSQAEPLAWYTIRSKDGKQTLEFGSCMPTNPTYIAAHKEWDWIPLYAAPVAQPAAPVADLTDAQKAAPELLAALQAVVECQKHTYGRGIDLHIEMIDIAKRARAAIALATGSQS